MSHDDPGEPFETVDETRVFLRTVYGSSLAGTWSDWSEKGIDAAIEHATQYQAKEGRKMPMEIIEVKVLRRVTVKTRVDVVEDTAKS